MGEYPGVCVVSVDVVRPSQQLTTRSKVQVQGARRKEEEEVDGALTVLASETKRAPGDWRLGEGGRW